jgi:cytochrome P450
MLGIPAEELPVFDHWLTDFARRGDVSGVTPEVERKGEETIANYFMDLIGDRRKRPWDDLMTDLVRPDEGGGGSSATTNSWRPASR